MELRKPDDARADVQRFARDHGVQRELPPNEKEVLAMPEVNYFWDEIEDNVIEEYDENGNTIVEYTTEPTLYGAVLSQDRGGQVRHYHYDGQGNTTELTDENGNVTDTRKYSAFGEVTESTGVTEFPYQWGGNLGYGRDPLISQLFVRFRYLLPVSARWQSVDPLGIWMSDSPNLYQYSSNNPLVWNDPSGLLADNRACGSGDGDDACCCCPKPTTIENIKNTNTHPTAGAGYYVDFDAVLHTLWKPSKIYADCTLEWHEWYSTGVRYDLRPQGPLINIKPGQWEDLYAKASILLMFNDWRDKKMVTECEGGKEYSYTIHDTPGASAAGLTKKVIIRIAIVLRSDPSCMCDPPAVEHYIEVVVDPKKNPPQSLTEGKWKGAGTYPKGLPLKK